MSSDLRHWSNDLILDLIEMYRDRPCLWRVKSDEYKNKYLKNIAYKELVEFCKTRGFPDATRDFVVRKLQSLRGSFRKELKKMIDYLRQGKSYKTSLWYYNSLLFTKDQEAAYDEDEIEIGPNDDGSNSEDVQVSDEADEKIEVKKETEIDDEPSYDAPESPQSPPSPPTKRQKRQSEDCLQPEFVDIAQETRRIELSEFEITGMSIAKKLARMDSTQAIYAESLINNVIKKGLLKKLREETDLCDNMCGRRVLTVPKLTPIPTSSHAEGSHAYK